MKRRNTLLILITFAVLALCSFCIAACTGGAYGGNHNVPDVNANSVLHIERNRISFAKGMAVDTIDIIEKCKCTYLDGDGAAQEITSEQLLDGTVSYEEFDVDTLGSNKRVKLTHNDTVNYIFYDVNDYVINFYLDDEQTQLWKSVGASAQHNDALGLAVWVNIAQYNYSTDENAREANPDGTAKFNGWYDSADNLVTGLYTLPLPAAGNERVLNLHAGYLTDDEAAVLDISYDGSGKRVFSGYLGEETETVTIPEGVTYIDFSDVFGEKINFRKLHIPSTAVLDAPFMSPVNTIGLTEITVDGGNLRYSSYNGALYSKDYSVLYFMPASCILTEFHSSLTEFGSYSCAYWLLRSLELPESVTSLQHYCFAYSSLKDIKGLGDVSNIMSGVFYKSEMVAFEDEVASYILHPEDESGTKFMLSMVLDKSVKTYSVIKGTVDIAGDAFNGCTALESIDFGTELQNIGGSAFSGCTALKEINLPQSLVNLGPSVFYGCSSLERVIGLPDIAFTDGNGKYYEHTLPTQMFYKCTALKDVVLPQGMLTVGPYSFYNCSDLTEIVLPSSVTAVSSYAFYGCGFTTIDLPKGIRSLGTGAFSHSSLTEIDLSACADLKTLPVRCFEYTQLTSFDIPDRITEIPGYCFYLIKTIESISLNKVTRVGEYAFSHCEILDEIDWGEVRKIDTAAFGYCAFTEVVLSDNITYVGDYAFRNCTKLTSLYLGSGVQTFGLYPMDRDGKTFTSKMSFPVLYLSTAIKQINVSSENKYFKSVDGVLYGRTIGGKDYGEGGVLYAAPSGYVEESLTLPKEVRVIVPYALHYMSKLKSVTLNEGLENIGMGAFYNSKKLTALVLPSTVTNIGASILLSCTGVKSFSIAEGNETYSTDGNLVYSGDTLVMNMGFSAEVVIRDGIKKIDGAVFMNNAVIKSVVIPDSVEEIGFKAFNGCTKLTSITIGSGLKSLDPTAFSALNALETITVSADNPYFKTKDNILYSKDGTKLLLCAAKNGMTALSIEKGVTEIGDWAFSYHATLSEVKLPVGVKSVGDYSFYECRMINCFYGSEALENIGERAFSFVSSINAGDVTETRCCDVLKNVMLYGNVKTIGDNAFYGQYGIIHVFYKMSHAQVEAMLKGCGKNITYLTRGCPDGTTGTYHNNVLRCLFSQTEPTINYDGYSWFYLDEAGQPRVWQISNGRTKI